MRILCIAGLNEGKDYGYALIGGKPVSAAYLSGANGTVNEVTKWIAELVDNGVCSRNRRGVIYCRRLVRAQKYRTNGEKNGERYARLGICDNPLFSFAENKSGGGATGRGKGIGILEGISEGKEREEREERSKGKRRGARCEMPDDWYPTEAGIIYAKERGYAEPMVGKLVQKCRDYHISKGTQIAGERGLAATWRTWVNNAPRFDRFERNGSSRNGSSLSFADIAKGMWTDE
jgi:hypothetical protein